MKRALFALLFLTLLLSACAPKAKTPLSVFCAGSLIQPFANLERAFEAENPDIDVQNECHGSIQVIRHVTDLHKPIDVVATADYALIPMLMYATNDPQTGKPYANWAIQFASNRLGIAYTANSRYADEITPETWSEILARPDVRVGIADPRFDAAGYRALMVFQLAEAPANQPTLFEDMFAGQFRYPITTRTEETATLIHVPEILETTPNAHVVVRGSSIQLIALLESGDLDYAFEYESVIRQHNLQLLPLPDSLNLGVEQQAETYQRVTVVLDFQRFKVVKPIFQGGTIAYGITIPSNAPHPQEAARFIEFLLGEKGRQLMEADYHPIFQPALSNGQQNLPAALQPLTKPMP